MLTFLLHSLRTFVGKSQPFICKVSISLVKWHAAYYLVDTDNNNVSVVGVMSNFELFRTLFEKLEIRTVRTEFWRSNNFEPT